MENPTDTSGRHPTRCLSQDTKACFVRENQVIINIFSGAIPALLLYIAK